MDRFKISVFFLVIILALVYGRRVQNPCGLNDIPCDNGQCIYRTYWCDDTTDCDDSSDEKYCRRRENNCNDKHFVCGDGKCIPNAARCDGYRQCEDETDEENCEFDEPISSTTTTTTTTTTTEIPTSPINRREDESNKNNRYDYAPSRLSISTPPTPHYDYGIRNYDRDFNPYNVRSDTYPGRNFLNTEFTTEAVLERRPDRPTTRTRQDTSIIEDPYIVRQPSQIFPPRSILYPPRRKSPSSRHRTVRIPNYPHFYFAKNYTEDFLYKYKNNIKDAKAWLLSQRDDSYSWGRDTPRALIALSLISNSFKSEEEDNELLKKSFQTHLGIKILRNDSTIEKMSTTRLAMYINALLATCQEPRDFLGRDLVENLHYTQYHLEQYQKFINPLIFLSLCLADIDFDENYLQGFLVNSFPTEISKDLHILATTAMACLSQRKPHDSFIRSKLDEAARSLLSQMNPVTGSFGSKYSTALAAQALMSVNSSWNPRQTLDYLAEQQQRDGSFGDMQLTYYTLIALSGRSLLHLRNTLCDTLNDTKEWSPEDILNAEGPRKNIFYSLRFGYPETFSAGMRLSVPDDTNFYDIMRVAAYQDPRFKFSYKITNGQLGVHTIANVPNDPERGMFWTLYWLPPSAGQIDFRERYKGDMKTLNPREGDEMLFWYLSDVDL